MSVRCITTVLEKSQHGGTQLLMLLVLADYSDDEGRSYPAVRSLALKCRMTPRNAQYILTALQASGELGVIKNAGPRGCNLYRINMDALAMAAPLKPISSLKSASRVKPVSPEGEAGFAKGVKPTASEPSVNRQGTVTAHKRGKGTDHLQDLLVGVDPAVLADYIEVRESKGAAVLTRTFLKTMTDKAMAAGMSLCDAMRLCIEKNWISFHPPIQGSAVNKAEKTAWEGAK